MRKAIPPISGWPHVSSDIEQRADCFVASRIEVRKLVPIVIEAAPVSIMEIEVIKRHMASAIRLQKAHAAVKAMPVAR